MKKTLYIGAFTLLGVLVSFLTHALVEIPAIMLLVSDFERWGFGLSWDAWVTIHNIGGGVLLVLGVVIGAMSGRHWWKVIYVNKLKT